MTTLALVPSAVRRRGILAEASLLAAGVAFIGLSAQLVLPLPFTPVPVTGQTFAVLLVGGVYGTVRGAAVLLTYLVAGIAGAPFFAAAGSGVAHLLSPSGGYLVGMVLAAVLVGTLAERGWDRRLSTSGLAMVMGNLVIYAVGLLWLGASLGTSVVDTLALGALPFVLGDLIKIALATAVLPAAWRLVDRFRD
ncbi:acetyl-COA carboxylase [Intrasporangium chromatireducens Q5-1]|uniref:Biotin transporter n=1 Tax=Intrasporangium chromatireducens Q5-1 TaxID=584657 RepID=W9GN41_9MICO|nr:biotin transporter BioY [Intrasporangium chromatireducens]EWT05324.1 acetyl-COA carboxylase [Intrasporangium chromatireducens Q5-1]